MLPKKIQQFFWSYDVNKVDLAKDKNLVIFNVLNYGDYGAWRWLFRKFGKREIKKTVRNSIASEWNKKSLNYWSIVLDSVPKRATRFD